jgi:deazaflavin-dependent oxidoreductase (nitroreductase family)
MRIPEAFFPLINRLMKVLLASPLHSVVSGSLMTIHYIGRRSGRQLWTPVRYLREDDGALVALTSKSTGWWPNLVEPVAVEVQVAGRRRKAIAQAFANDSQRTEPALRRALARFPGDAPYHGITAKRGSDTYQAQFEDAILNDVVVVFRLKD